MRKMMVAAVVAAIAGGFNPSMGAEGSGGVIRHRFLGIDEGSHLLHHVDQTDPSRNWRVPFGNNCNMDMQLIGGDKVLMAVDDGYKEFALADGKQIKTFTGKLGGLITTIERLADGRTLLGGIGLTGIGDGFIVLDAQDNVLAKISIPGVHKIRHLRSTARGTLLLAAVDKIVECQLDGTVVWSAPMAGNNFKAVELDAEKVMVASGPYSRFIRTIDRTGKVLSTIEGKELKEGSFTGFQRLANGNIVVAVWLGHGPNHNGIVAVEYDADGKQVWSYGVEGASFVEIIVLDGLDTGKLHAQHVNGVLAPVKIGKE